MLKNNNKILFIATFLGLNLLFLIFFKFELLKNIIYTDFLNLNSFRYFENFLFIPIIIILLTQTILYIFSFKYFKKIKKNINIKHLFIIFFLLNIILSFVAPLTTTDLNSYTYQARISSVHNEDPYNKVFNDFKNDKFYNELSNKWSKKTSPYGPVFMFFADVITSLEKNNLNLTTYFFKIFFIALNILCGLLVYKITKSKESFYLYTFNPFILFEISINAHNDILLIFFVLLSILFFKKEGWKNQALSLFFMALSILTKTYSLMLAPFLLIGVIKKNNNPKKLLKILLSSALLTMTTFLMLLNYLDSSFPNFILSIKNQVTTTGSLSPLMLLFKNLNLNFSEQIGFFIFATISVIYFFKKLLEKKNNNNSLIKTKNLYLAFTIETSLFLFFVLRWFMPWYLLMLITILILRHKEEKKITNKNFINLYFIQAVTIFAILFYINLR